MAKKKVTKSRIPALPVAAMEQSTVFPTALGWILLSWQSDQLTRISFGNSSPAEAAQHAETEPLPMGAAPGWIKRLMVKLQKYIAGKDVDFSKLPLATDGTKFQRRVQEACQNIPRGQVRSYGEIAAAAGAPGAARAVGSAMRANRFPLVVPCHRVVASGGKLGGFSCPAGLEMKKKLLQLEGIELGK